MNRGIMYIAMAGGVFVLFGVIAAQPPQAKDPIDQPGVEVLTRGPIHEAFAEPGFEKQGPSLVIAKKPPDPINELPPEDRPEGDQDQWIPGYWAWDDDRGNYVWVSGIWRVPPPNRQWIPGYWQQVEGGWQWVSGYWAPAGQNTVDLYPPPPDPVEEAIPPPPEQDMTFVPGIWMYVDDQYAWRPGHWIANQPGWVWTPASYCWTPGGYVFVDGYWDHDLDNRGFAFAPVAIDPSVAQRPGWSYRPSYAIATDFLPNSLFVRRNGHHYYFGDYHDPADARKGYIPWLDHRIARDVPDPLFSYYRWQNRNNKQWEKQLRSEYKARQEGTLARPARTLMQQHKELAQKREKAVRTVVPLKQWQGKTFKLAPTSKAHAEEIHKNISQWRTLSAERGKAESQVKRVTSPGKQPAVAHQPVRINLPRTIIRRPTSVRRPPPHPAAPRPQIKHKGK